MAKIRWDREIDLLVAGAGPGGMTAGLVAGLEGLDVQICENPSLWAALAQHLQVRFGSQKTHKAATKDMSTVPTTRPLISML